MFWEKYNKIKEQNPLIHCITNYITINDCANILYAVGASPIMTCNINEVEEVAKTSNGLVCNLGATENFDSMKMATRKAYEKGIPIVIDPVGVGGITYRRERFWELIENLKPTCIRGNVSEIKALVENRNTVRGIDVEKSNEVFQTEVNAKELSKRLGCIVVASGETDIISNGNEVYKIKSGDQLMAGISGTGCMMSAVIGAFLSVENNIESVREACTFYGICGETAAQKTLKDKGGIMTFKTNFIDSVSTLEISGFEAF